MKKQLRQYASLLTWETLEHLMKYMENISQKNQQEAAQLLKNFQRMFYAKLKLQLKSNHYMSIMEEFYMDKNLLEITGYDGEYGKIQLFDEN